MPQHWTVVAIRAKADALDALSREDCRGSDVSDTLNGRRRECERDRRFHMQRRRVEDREARQVVLADE